jgi:SAM-dependent methyltransferase
VTDTTAFDRHERELWAGRAGAYRRSFARLCAYPADLVLDAAGVRAGTAVLDVGTGPGTLAALAVVRGAKVTAVDPEPSMVSAAGHLIPDVRVAALPDLPFPDGSFDAVVANFVLNHVGAPAAAVGELARVARPGGRVAVTIWPYPQPPLQRLWGDALAAAGVPVPDDLPALEPERDFQRTPEGLAGLLAGAFGEVRVERVEWTHRADPEDWWSGPANGLGTLGLIMQRVGPAASDRIRAAYDELSTAFLAEGGLLALPTAALLGSGTAPG